MRYFPMFLKMAGRRVVIVGGGALAARKARLILKTEAAIDIAAPTLDPELAHEVERGRIRHMDGPLEANHFKHATLVFIATGCPGADAAAHALAARAGVLVNVVDAPDLCDAVTPSIVDRDPVVVAIGTEGTAPVLGRQIKTDIEAMLEPRLGDLASLCGRLRGAVRHISAGDRRALWRWVFKGPAREAHRGGREREAADQIKARIQALKSSDALGEEKGLVSLIGAGPGASDLITIRGVQRLQEADVIFYDRLVDPALLELARRDADRVDVGKAVGAPAWPQDRINGVIAAAARQGKRVVRLKSGDPALFGRVSEEIAALDAAGIAWEIVPGVTAASAAAAALGRSLTERGEIDTVILTTGRCRDGDARPGWQDGLRPGVLAVFYMAVGSAPHIQQDFLQAGEAPNLPVDIVEAIGSATERRFSTTLARLAETVSSNDIANPAIIMVRKSKRHRRKFDRPSMDDINALEAGGARLVG